MAKRTKLKTALTIVTVVLLIILLYFYMGMVFMPKDRVDRGGLNYYYTTAIYTEKVNSLDVLFMGNSDVYSAINPLQIYNDVGIASYNWCFAKQSVNVIKQDFKKILNRQSPKVLVLDVDCFYAKNIVINTKMAPAFIAPFEYHVRWKQLQLKDFYTIPKYIPDEYKGYIYSDVIGSFKLKPDYMQDVNAEAKAIAKSVKRDLLAIKQLCDKNGVELLFICVPTPHSWSNAKSNAVQQLSQEMGVPYLDMNYPDFGDNFEYEFDFDYSKHFRDNGNHLNFNGATVVSKFMANYLRDNYDIADKRQEADYADWNALIEMYGNQVVR